MAQHPCPQRLLHQLSWRQLQRCRERPAHESMIPNPLEDTYTNCHACHPDYPERAARFAAELGITPTSQETPTPVPIPLDEPQPPDPVLPADISSVPAPQPPIGLINTGLLLAILIYGLIWQEKRRVLH